MLARESSIAAVALSVSNANEQNEAIKASFNEHKTWRETYTNEIKSAIAANFLSVSDQSTKLQKLDAKLAILVDQDGKETKSQQQISGLKTMYNSQKEQISGLKSMMEQNENEVRSLKEMIEKLLKEKNSPDSPDNTRKV